MQPAPPAALQLASRLKQLRQEFGDVLAEGLYALLHLGPDAAQATSEYWGTFLDATAFP